MATVLERGKHSPIMAMMFTISLIVHLLISLHIAERYKIKPEIEKPKPPIKIEIVLQELPKPTPIETPPIPQHSSPAVTDSLYKPIQIPKPLPEPIKQEVKKMEISEPSLVKPVKEITKSEPVKKKVVVEKRKKPVEKTKNKIPVPVNKAVEKPPIQEHKKVAQKMVNAPTQTAKPVILSSPVNAAQAVKVPYSGRVNSQPLSSKSDEISAKAYFNTMRLMIEKNKRYPQMARRRNHEGSVRVKFVVDSNGNVNALEIVKGSDYESLNKAALEAVRRAAPFAKPPSSIGKNALKLELTINFKLI